jgi:hypothetical protein
MRFADHRARQNRSDFRFSSARQRFQGDKLSVDQKTGTGRNVTFEVEQLVRIHLLFCEASNDILQLGIGQAVEHRYLPQDFRSNRHLLRTDECTSFGKGT